MSTPGSPLLSREQGGRSARASRSSQVHLIEAIHGREAGAEGSMSRFVNNSTNLEISMRGVARSTAPSRHEWSIHRFRPAFRSPWLSLSRLFSEGGSNAPDPTRGALGFSTAEELSPMERASSRRGSMPDLRLESLSSPEFSHTNITSDAVAPSPPQNPSEAASKNDLQNGAAGDAPKHRVCFICLEDEDLQAPGEELLPCCSQCYAVVHAECWNAWRSNQKLDHIRYRLLGSETANPRICTICKTGLAQVRYTDGSVSEAGATTEAQMQLQEQFLETLSRVLRSSDEDLDDQADEPPLCSGLATCINLVLIVSVAIFDLVYMGVAESYPGDVILCSLLVLYEILVIELLILAVQQRRAALGQFITWPRRQLGVLTIGAPQLSRTSGPIDEPAIGGSHSPTTPPRRSFPPVRERSLLQSIRTTFLMLHSNRRPRTSPAQSIAAAHLDAALLRDPEEGSLALEMQQGHPHIPNLDRETWWGRLVYDAERDV